MIYLIIKKEKHETCEGFENENLSFVGYCDDEDDAEKACNVLNRANKDKNAYYYNEELEYLG